MKLEIKNASVTLGSNTILEEVNFEINDGDHIAIVGRNGAGKTTLLKALINQELFTEGIGLDKFQITKIGNFNPGYLEQITFSDESITLIDEIEKYAADLVNMSKTLEKLVEEMNKNNSDTLIKKYTDLQESFKLLGGYSYKKEYEVILNKFGFTNKDKTKKLCEFSGGQKTKIALIKLLLSHPDVLILDEPTNHLDIVAIEWLEDYLKNYKGALILVSHDRMFLNNIVNIIYDIDYGKVIRYKGNYEFFEKMKKDNYNRMLKNYEIQQKEIIRLKSIYERFRSKPTKASMALSRLKQIEKMDLLEKPHEEDLKVFKTNLSEMEESSKKVIVLDNLVIGYDTPLATISLEVKRGERIGVIGSNGTGKSTLLKTLHGVIDPIDGNVSYGLKVLPGYFDQNLLMLDNNNTVLEEFRNYLPSLEMSDARKALGSFLFKGDDVHKKVSVLSGGEKVRLELCKILYEHPNLLILDEPTNHMDIIGKEHLEDILSEYKGTLIFVSHDRYFVNKLATSLLVFEDNKINFYPYNYKEYMEKIKNKEVKIDEQKHEEQKEIKNNKINVYELKKDLNKLENQIIKLETKIKTLEAEIYNVDVYLDYQKINALNDKIKKEKEELEKLNQEWEALTNILIKN